MHVELKFTGDGILAFIGGALALIGVWLSNRQSVLNLQKQLDAERKARDTERENQRDTLAIALHFEIQSFVLSELDSVQMWLKNCDPVENIVSFSIPLRERSFPIYEGGADKLGNLSRKALLAVVGFYTAGESYRVMCGDYNTCMGLMYRQQNVDLMAARAKVLLKEIKSLIPTLRELALNVLKRLESEYGIAPMDVNLNAQTN